MLSQHNLELQGGAKQYAAISDNVDKILLNIRSRIVPTSINAAPSEQMTDFINTVSTHLFSIRKSYDWTLFQYRMGLYGIALPLIEGKPADYVRRFIPFCVLYAMLFPRSIPHNKVCEFMSNMYNIDVKSRDEEIKFNTMSESDIQYLPNLIEFIESLTGKLGTVDFAGFLTSITAESIENMKLADIITTPFVTDIEAASINPYIHSTLTLAMRSKEFSEQVFSIEHLLNCIYNVLEIEILNFRAFNIATDYAIDSAVSNLKAHELTGIKLLENENKYNDLQLLIADSMPKVIPKIKFSNFELEFEEPRSMTSELDNEKNILTNFIESTVLDPELLNLGMFIGHYNQMYEEVAEDPSEHGNPLKLIEIEGAFELGWPVNNRKEFDTHYNYIIELTSKNLGTPSKQAKLVGIPIPSDPVSVKETDDTHHEHIKVAGKNTLFEMGTSRINVICESGYYFINPSVNVYELLEEITVNINKYDLSGAISGTVAENIWESHMQKYEWSAK